jgi:hypothetical protein
MPKKENLCLIYSGKSFPRNNAGNTHDSNCDYLILVTLGEVTQMEEYLKPLLSSNTKKTCLNLFYTGKCFQQDHAGKHMTATVTT